MVNFDFHNLFFPTEFEKFCRDIVDIREKPITFTTYRRGKDGGIDFKSTNTETKIIGQCKLYNPNSYNDFFTNLKGEVKKCQRQKPDRYILCTNILLSPLQAEKILNLFQDYILTEEDIIDGEKLNKYLGIGDYQHLLKNYSKLLVPNLFFIELALEAIVNRKYYNKTAYFLKEIHKEHKLFHNTKILKHCIDTLEKNKFIILTGNPGVGKTTTAKMIANYFLNQKVKKILFLSDRDFNEVEGLYQEDQIIVVDDFWGQNFSPLLKNSILLRDFNRIVNSFKEGSNQYLILTSREYIIKDVLSHSEFEAKRILNTDKFVINLDDYSKEDKVRIFLNHLMFYDFEKGYFNYLKYSDVLENIIIHKNYSPRHIEYFIKQYQDSDAQNQYDFYFLFLKYLDSPNEYWNNNFSKLTGTSKLIFLILLISSDPIDLIDLEKTFAAVQEAARNSLNENIEPLLFKHELKLLEDFYVVSEKQEHLEQILIRFQSPGIKDFLLEYLRNGGNAWIKSIIQNALFFNQLNFVFGTEDEEIHDYDSNVSLFGRKIVLSEILKNILKNKILTEFQYLNFCTQQEREFSGEFSTNHTSEETKYWKLILLNNLFDISCDTNQDVRLFIINEVRKDIDGYRSKGKILDSHSMQEFPKIIEMINPFIQLNADYLISSYYNSITFTREFDSFYEFQEIFPTEFTHFIESNIILIRKNIKRQIIDDIEYYDWDDMAIELDFHLDYTIEKVCKKYKIRLTSKFVSEIEAIAGRRLLRSIKLKKGMKKNNISTSKPKDTYKDKRFDFILKDYLPDEMDTYFDPIRYLKNVNLNENLSNNLKKAIKNSESFVDPFISNESIFSYFIKMIEEESIVISPSNQY
ncbi:hypothetical protein [Fibrella arboris]|uniref:nSTAND3 domain-containing NTPase n=1 Tax=Fibrella arboris TaxID=3242486 RepID=UPI0035211700